MKALLILIGMGAGLLAGWLGMRGFGPAKAETPVAPRAERSDAPARWLRNALLERESMGKVQERAAFLKARRNRDAEGRSPYRGQAWEQSWLKAMPLEDVVEMLENGELHRHEEIQIAFQRWVEADPEAALEAVDRLNLARSHRSAAKTTVYRHWAKHNPFGLLEKIERMESSMDREGKARLLITEWGNVDPHRALEMLDRLTALYARPETHASRLREQFLTAWLQEDAEQALAWVETVEDPAEKERLRESLVTAKLNGGKMSEAVEFILSQPEDRKLQQHLPKYWQDWADRNPAPALEKLATLPENHPMWEHQAGMVIQSAASTAILTERTESLKSALDKIPEGFQRRKVLRSLVWGAGSNDPALAREFIDQLPESREREEATDFFIGVLGREDLAAAGEWLQQQQPSASKDAAIARFALDLVADEPALAAEWADTIGRSERQRRTREKLFARWREQDPEAAQAWRDGWK